MRKILSLLTAVLLVGSVWATDPDPVVCTFPSSGSITNNTITVNSVAWSISTTIGKGEPTYGLNNVTYNSTQKSAIKFGSSKNVYYSNISFATDYFSGYNVTGVSIEYALNGGVSTTLTATQGSTTIGSDTYSTGQTWHTSTLNTATGSGGTLTISITTTQSISIHKITISYNADEVTFCANPAFSVIGGVYEEAQSVTLSCSTDGATIKYTTDGTNPSSSNGTTYASAIAVSESMTIKAIAIKDGLDDSEVVSATFTILAAPDVVLDFTDNTDWKFPTEKTVDETTYTAGGYSIKVAGSAGQGFLWDDSGKNLMIGKSGAYLVLPTFADDAIVRISTPGIASGASGAVTFNVFDGETAVSTQVTGCTEDHAFNISPKKKNIAYKIKVTNANNVRFSKIKIWLGEPDAATAVDNTDAEVKAVKTIVNGQLFIEKNGKVYNILGTLVK